MSVRNFIFKYPIGSVSILIGLVGPLFVIGTFNLSEDKRIPLPRTYPLPAQRLEGLNKYAD